MVATATEFQTASGRSTIIRSLEPSDGAAVAEFKQRLSRRARAALDLNEYGEPTFVACDRETGRIAGLGTYTATDPGVAEVSFAVAYDLRDEGIGAALLQELALHARDHGFREFTAHVPVENDRTFEALWHSAYPMCCRNDGGVTFVSLTLRD